MPNPDYLGPRSLERDTTVAIEVLATRLSIEQSVGPSHSVLLVKGCSDDETLEATAVYLVAAIAQSIAANLSIRKALFDVHDVNRKLTDDIVSVVGTEDIDNDFKAKTRDPWMWEAISHMVIHLSRLKSELHPSGRILAKANLKHDVRDHGLDLIAIYEATDVGISAGECKAYLDNPSRAITDASNRLSEVDANKRDIEIRAAVNQLHSALDSDVQARIAGAFWKEERSYLPFVCCDDNQSIDWQQERPVLQRLNVPVNRKILYPMPLPGGSVTFDRISRLMHAYATIGA